MLTPFALPLHTDTATPHCVVRLGSRGSVGAQPRSSGFFVQIVQQIRVMAGLNWEAFGSAGANDRSANLIQSRLPLRGSFDGGVKTSSLEYCAMATQAQNSPAFRLSNLDALDVASARITQAIAFLDVLMLASSSNDTIVSRDTVTNSTWGVRQLLEQASAAVEGV